MSDGASSYEMNSCTISLFLTFFAMSLKPLVRSEEATLLKYEFNNDGLGSYNFEYAQTDGQERNETGTLENPGSANEELVIRGSFSFVGLDGVTYQVNYTADKDGFHPEGDHFKVPPYTPWPVNRHLDYTEQIHHQHSSTVDKQHVHQFDEITNFQEHPVRQSEEQTTLTQSTPPPSVTNTYIPSSPSPVAFKTNNYSAAPTNEQKQIYHSDKIQSTYLPSTSEKPRPFSDELNAALSSMSPISIANQQIPSTVNIKPASTKLSKKSYNAGTRNYKSVQVSPSNPLPAGSSILSRFVHSEESKTRSKPFDVINIGHSDGGVFGREK